MYLLRVRFYLLICLRDWPVITLSLVLRQSTETRVREIRLLNRVFVSSESSKEIDKLNWPEI